MPHLFLSEQITKTEDQLLIEGDAARHLAGSLRAKVGESLIVTDDAAGGDHSIDYHGLIESVAPTCVIARITGSQPNTAEPSVQVTLYQCLPKGDKFEFILQKAVELGASRIVPVLSSRCISRPSPAAFQKKRLRLQKIAQSAAEQSGRGKIPIVGDLIMFAAACQKAEKAERALICYEQGGEPIGQNDLSKVQRIALLIGPEGGFSAEEIDLARKHQLQITTLGPRILRCETAPLVGLSLILYQTGNLGSS